MCQCCRAELLGYPPRLVVLRSAGGAVMAAGPYSPRTARILSAYKEYRQWRLAEPLAQRLALAVAAMLASVGGVPQQPWWLVPMPSRQRAVRRRGADVVARLAQHCAGLICAELDTPVGVWPGLAMSSRVRDQAGLDRAARQLNLRDQLRLRRRPPAGPLLLIDDVTTTGATLRAAHRLVTGQGLAVLGGAVVAKVSSAKPHPGFRNSELLGLAAPTRGTSATGVDKTLTSPIRPMRARPTIRLITAAASGSSTNT